MNLNTIGEILRFYREKYDFKQSDVCNGICSLWRKHEKTKDIFKK